jgi:hypothetical protein
MAISQTTEFAELDDLYLDPRNPRLGRHPDEKPLSQDEILGLMEEWKLDELATSFLVNGQFWVNEAVLVVEEKIYGKPRKVVVEGNRRLAALMLLRNAFNGKPISRKWRDLVEGETLPPNLFQRIPYLKVDDRSDVEAFLGFRHVTGIEEWRPAEKAAYIARMVDESGFSYRDVMRKIGSKTPTVRQHYIAHKLRLRLDDLTEIPASNFDDRFSVMYLSLRTIGVQRYLNIDITAEPDQVNLEIPAIPQRNLEKFALWLFGDDKRDPVFSDSRKIDLFGATLENDRSRAYLEDAEYPRFEIAVQLSGGDESEIEGFILKASENIQMALTRAHHYKDSEKTKKAIVNFAKDARQLVDIFPAAKAIICE